jgi:hypothetical protein
MGHRLRGDDGFEANTTRYVILAQARTHNTPPKSLHYGVRTTFRQSSSFLSNILYPSAA